MRAAPKRTATQLDTYLGHLKTLKFVRDASVSDSEKLGDATLGYYYDVWPPNLSPSAELVQFAQRSQDEKSWKAFERKFRAEMNKPDQARVLDLLTAFSRQTSFSIGCYCENEERCHRLILKKLLAERGVEFS